LQKEEVDAHGESPGSLTQFQRLYENNSIIPSEKNAYLVQKNQYQIPNLSQESPELETAIVIADCYTDSYLFEIQTFKKNVKASSL
jgi:hypothetical protein